MFKGNGGMRLVGGMPPEHLAARLEKSRGLHPLEAYRAVVRASDKDGLGAHLVLSYATWSLDSFGMCWDLNGPGAPAVGGRPAVLGLAVSENRTFRHKTVRAFLGVRPKARAAPVPLCRVPVLVNKSPTLDRAVELAVRRVLSRADAAGAGARALAADKISDERACWFLWKAVKTFRNSGLRFLGMDRIRRVYMSYFGKGKVHRSAWALYRHFCAEARRKPQHLRVVDAQVDFLRALTGGASWTK